MMPPAARRKAITRDETGLIEALTKELKGQRWDADKSVWK